ncbi:hypothetical protein [Desulfonatronum parangueonense]
MLECWDAGMLECWDAGYAGMLECWDAGMLGCWDAGMLELLEFYPWNRGGHWGDLLEWGVAVNVCNQEIDDLSFMTYARCTHSQ